MSIPLVSLKSLQNRNNIFPVPTAMSKYRSFDSNLYKASEHNSEGYSGLNFS